MNLYDLLRQRGATGKPVRIGVIGAGVYSSMFISQLYSIPGMQLVGVAELDTEKAKKSCLRAGWPEEGISFTNSTNAINDAYRNKKVSLTNDAEQLIKAELDVILEVTGVAEAGAYHAWTALEAGKHVVMVTVEADALLGKALKELADKVGLVYSLGYGDEPACLCEQIDWARTSGFEVVCVGKCVPYKPEKHYSTPETGWKYYGLSEEQVTSGDYNLKMYNSFVDGTKSNTEMCSVANACHLIPQAGGLQYPAIEYEDLPSQLKSKAEGGILDHNGTIEILSSVKRDGTPLKRTLRWGTYLVFRGCSDQVIYYLRHFSREHRILADASGEYSIIYRPTHLIGLELGISAASVGLLGVPTGTPKVYVADVTTVAKKDLKPGDVIDGEGGYTVYGQLVQAQQSIEGGYLPMGLSNKTKVKKNVAKDTIVTYDDVIMDESSFIYPIRKKIEEEYLNTDR
ncbi:NAD(P)H-dependent oxidoreductase [Chloroflexota bacterium]